MKDKILLFMLIVILAGLTFTLGWLIKPTQIITVNMPYEVKVLELYPIIEYVDRWHEPEVITVNNTILKEIEKPVEVEKVVYRNRLPQEWESVEQFENWYYSQGFTLLMTSGAYTVDCDDYAEWVNREALKQSYHISDALTWNGMYYNKKVTNKYKPEQPGHVGGLVLIQGTYYYFEPMIKDFNGLVKVVDRD